MTKQKKGFALFDPDKLKALASKAGKKAQANGRAHKFNSQTAKVAGRKGGQAIAAKMGSDYFGDIGQRGGLALKKKREMGL